MDVDAVGGAATGGLIGAAIEKPTGHAGQHHGVCTDCGAETSGRFCSSCGQPTHVHRTLLHLFEEMLHGVMHFDSRIWRTLPLLAFNPGKLTREWVMGKRTRYVSPLAMFLFTIFVLFMGLSFVPVSETAAPASVRGQAASAGDLAMKISAQTQAEAALAASSQPGSATPQAQREILQRQVAKAREDVARASAALGPPRPGQKAAAEPQPKVHVAQETWEEELAAKARSGEFKPNTGNKSLDKKLQKKLENPALALYKIQQTVYKFSFLLIPISIPFVALLFIWKRGFTFYDHGVFVLYSLTFMAMLTMAAALIIRYGGKAGSDIVAIAIAFIVPWHMFAQIKGAYGLRFFSAAWRTFFLVIFSTIALSLFLVAIIMLGLTG